MSFPHIDAVKLEGGGVIFKYLVFDLELKGEKKILVRGMNYKGYAGAVEDRLVEQMRGELDQNGFLQNGGRYVVLGGGSISMNPYYETITVFGASLAYGAESDREMIARLIREACPERQVSWFAPQPAGQKAES